MKLSTSTFENVNEIKLISASSTYGIGFLTAFVSYFCHIFGVECSMYNEKIEKAKSAAASKLIQKAEELSADGIMSVRFQITGLTVFVYGVAYRAE